MKIVEGEIYKKIGSSIEVEVLKLSKNESKVGDWFYSVVDYKDTLSGSEMRISENDFLKTFVPKYLRKGDEVCEISMGRVAYKFKVYEIQNGRAICSGVFHNYPIISVCEEVRSDGSLDGHSRIQGSTYYISGSNVSRILSNKRIKAEYVRKFEEVMKRAVDKICNTDGVEAVELQLDILLDKIIKATKEIK